MALRDTVKVIFDIIYHLANAPDGMSRGEIVETYKISPGTAHKYIGIIEDMGVPIYTEGQRYYVSDSYFVNLKLTAEESEFLFLALERSLTYHTSQWQLVRSLVDKIGRKLDSGSMGALRRQMDAERGSLETARFFTTLVQARKQRREVWVDYFPLHREEPSRWLVRPYRFVSNPLSDGFYVLCDGTRGEGQIYRGLSLKFDRIQDVRLTNQQFAIVDQARFQSHFGRAWGVWSSQRDPIRVVLRFEPRHYDRLLESIWHPSQQIHTDADGYISYSVDVSEPEEMVPWIRSWGSGVVVEAPQRLRQRVIRSLKRQVRHYGLTLGSGAEPESRLYLLWAKRDPKGKPKAKTRAYHALIYHLLDVAAVAGCMWDDVLGAGQKDWLMAMIGLDEAAARGMLALLAGLHDIGKATPAFQKKVPDLYAKLGNDLHDDSTYADDHGILSAVILRRWFIDKGLGKQPANQLAAVIGGHHGSWISNTETGNKQVGNEKWQDLQNQLCGTLQEVLGAAEISPPESPQAFNIFAAFLSGFVSVCDWIGSNRVYFPYEDEVISPQNYFQVAQEQAKKALHEMEWVGWKSDGRKPAFNDDFSFAPNALQQEGIQHLQEFEQAPRLILVEYPTGEGKTELALHIGDRLVNRFNLAGTYIAMPTQATSNQMFERVETYLRKRYRCKNLNPQLIHGGAEQYKSSRQHTLSESNQEGNESAADADSWFEQNRKRALLTPYAVGTIDQAMLSVLQVKHHFVRQFGLSRKVIVFDEIHSYDTYMNKIIERLFEWLHALDSPMILLSATLSRQDRQDILKAAGASEEAPDECYPRLTVVENDGKVRVHALPPPKTRAIQIRQIALGLDSLLDAVRLMYEKGGCIAIVCNTVNESIEVARHLRQAEGIDEEEVWLLHARFPPAWRGEMEEKVVDAFGKEGTRPERAILVATQIIEQSLDLDFDLMVSRTAPIDLLIQRMGRLHRHPRSSRPSHLAKPTLLLRTPDMKTDDVPDFGVDEAVYERFFLLKTWLRLRDVEQVQIPDGVDELMNFVYDQEVDIKNISSAYREALAAARDDMKLGNRNSEFRGAQFVIGEPSSKRLIGRYSARLSDDEERSIKTRNIRPGLGIICIMDEDSLALIQRKPSRDDVNSLLRYKVTVRHRDVKYALEQLEANPNWKRIPQLKYARAVEFDGDRYDAPNSPYSLRLTPDYGLEIIRQEEA